MAVGDVCRTCGNVLIGFDGVRAKKCRPCRERAKARGKMEVADGR